MVAQHYSRSSIIERLLRLGNRVPSKDEPGYHLCCCDSEHKHLLEPPDPSKLVDVATASAGGTKQSLH